jgi:CubicO group peptidase (beta-lactamase class C family)
VLTRPLGSIAVVLLAFSGAYAEGGDSPQGAAVERWDTWETPLQASRTYVNPFTDVDVTAAFTHAASGKTLAVCGFYDGGSTWRIRFMPMEPGTWNYVTKSSDPGLDGKAGRLTCVPPTRPFLHGPLAAQGFHFVHADGTRRLLVSTRLSCQFAPPEVWPPVIEFLKAHRINRVLFMMGGVAGSFKDLYGEGPDFSRYNVKKFRAIDPFIDTMRRADIVASPYFYYFNDKVQRKLTPEQDRAYIRYSMARFGAYANVMPVLANEVEQKATDRRGQYDLAAHAWANKMGPYLASQTVFGLPVTVHNPMETEQAVRPGFYTLLADWPFPWACCMLRQAQVGALGAAPALSDDVPEQKNPVYNARAYARHNSLLIDLRRFKAPVINEEPGYEMGSPKAGAKVLPWNSQTSETLLPTFWTAATAGAYAMWGSAGTYETGDPLAALKASRMPGYIRILHDFLAALPYWEMEPANEAVSAAETTVEGAAYRTNFCLAKAGEAYLVFSLGGGAVTVNLAPGAAYDAIQLDPRTGKRTDLGRVDGGSRGFTLSGPEQVLLCRRAGAAVASEPVLPEPKAPPAAPSPAVAGTYYPPPESAGGWRSLVPPNKTPSADQKRALRQAAGLDWDRLRAAWDYCEGFGGPDSLLVIRHGWVAAEWSNITDLRGVASCTKSLTSLAMARLFDLSDAGRLPQPIGPDDEAWRWLPASWAEAEPARRQIRIRHMLTMTSGLTPYDGPYKQEYPERVFAQTVESPPGEVWAYASVPVDMLSLIVERAAGRDLGDFFNAEICAPIGAAAVKWGRFGEHTGGSGGPQGGARFPPRDLARVGYMVLHDGAWVRGGKALQVISADRLRQMTRWAPVLENTRWRQPNFAFEPNANQFYGHLWWTNRTGQGLGPAAPRDAVYMSGWGKQACFVVPSLDMVVVRLGPNRDLNEHPEFYPELWSRIMAAVVNPRSDSGPDDIGAAGQETRRANTQR